MGVGTHGWSHIPWTRLLPADVVREFSDARELLAEASGGEIFDAALPLGRYDRRAHSQLRDAGYRTVFTSDRFRANAASWLQAYYSVTATDNVDSMQTLLSHRASLSEVRNITASLVKRIR